MSKNGISVLPPKHTISVVIITRNRKELLLCCVQSILKNLPEAELIVVEDGSDERQSIQKEELVTTNNIHVIALQKNIGVAAARNIGIQASNGTILVFIDDDAYIQSISSVFIEKVFQDESISLIAPHIMYPNNTTQESVRSYPTLLSLFWRGTPLHRWFPKISWYKKYVGHTIHQTHDIEWAIGACLIVRRSTLEKIGNFDEKFTFGYDDADLCYRIRREKKRLIYHPKIQIIHAYTRTSAHGINQYTIKHIKSIIRFFIKHPFYINT